MLQTNIIASKIANLTDARYFSAWGVEALAFDLNTESPEFVSPIHLNAFREWISGPVIIGEFNGLQAKEDITKVAADLSLDYILLGPFAPQDWEFEVPVIRELILGQFQDLPPAEKYIIKVEDIDQDVSKMIDDLAQLSFDFYLDFPMTESQVQTLIDIPHLKGIILKGGEEEKVGFKSYDEIDAILEALEIE